MNTPATPRTKLHYDHSKSSLAWGCIRKMRKVNSEGDSWFRVEGAIVQKFMTLGFRV